MCVFAFDKEQNNRSLCWRTVENMSYRSLSVSFFFKKPLSSSSPLSQTEVEVTPFAHALVRSSSFRPTHRLSAKASQGGSGFKEESQVGHGLVWRGGILKINPQHACSSDCALATRAQPTATCVCVCVCVCADVAASWKETKASSSWPFWPTTR